MAAPIKCDERPFGGAPPSQKYFVTFFSIFRKILATDPPLNYRPQHLIEAAKQGHLDQMIFFSAPLTTRAPPTTVPTTVRRDLEFLRGLCREKKTKSRFYEKSVLADGDPPLHPREHPRQFTIGVERFYNLLKVKVLACGQSQCI